MKLLHKLREILFGDQFCPNCDVELEVVKDYGYLQELECPKCGLKSSRGGAI